MPNTKDGKVGCVFEFGDWLVEPNLNRVRKGEVSRQLEPRTMDVLAYLLENAGDIVTVDELLSSVWVGRVVEPSAAHRNINQIRRALGDPARQSRYIETVAKRGYRVIAPVTRRQMTHHYDTALLSTLAAETPPFAAYVGEEKYRFVCYAHVDRTGVYAELVRLRDQGENLWYDEGIPPGSRWTEEIADAINGCSEFIFFVSPESVTSVNCINEVQFGLSRGKRVLAIHLQPTDLPASLELSMGSTQAIHKYELREADYRRKLATALDSGVSAISAVKPRAPARRKRWLAVALATSVLVVSVVLSVLSTQNIVEGTSRSIAVIPFVDMSPDRDQAWLGESIAAEIQAGLVEIPGLRIAGRSASVAFVDSKSSEYGSVAEVELLVEGTVRRSGNRIRVTVQLVSVRDGYQIWSDIYERELVDGFDAEIGVATDVINSLEQFIGAGEEPGLLITDGEIGLEADVLDGSQDARDAMALEELGEFLYQTTPPGEEDEQ